MPTGQKAAAVAKPESAATLFEKAAALFAQANEAKAREAAASSSGKNHPKASEAAQAKPKKKVQVCDDTSSYTSSFCSYSYSDEDEAPPAKRTRATSTAASSQGPPKEAPPRTVNASTPQPKEVKKKDTKEPKQPEKSMPTVTLKAAEKKPPASKGSSYKEEHKETAAKAKQYKHKKDKKEEEMQRGRRDDRERDRSRRGRHHKGPSPGPRRRRNDDVEKASRSPSIRGKSIEPSGTTPAPKRKGSPAPPPPWRPDEADGSDDEKKSHSAGGRRVIFTSLGPMYEEDERLVSIANLQVGTAREKYLCKSSKRMARALRYSYKDKRGPPQDRFGYIELADLAEYTKVPQEVCLQAALHSQHRRTGHHYFNLEHREDGLLYISASLQPGKTWD
jgi:hypothetical protein